MTSWAKRPNLALTIASILFVSNWGQTESAQYLGKFLGKLSELHHGVSGEVYAVDARTLHIKDFTYDGQGPAAYFFAGNSRAPGNTGFRIRDENGSPEVLRRYRKEGVTITLPEGKSLNNIKWFSVWCEEFEVNFGDVKIPKNFDYPRPLKIDGLSLRGVHGVSSDNIVIVDAQTLLVPSLSYDGEAPDAKFWVGRGEKPSPQGIRVPDENGKEIPLRRYDRKTVVLTLPGDLTVFDIGHFGIWCEAFTVDFGHVQIPASPNVPPSLRMLGVSPQSKLNCEVLHDDLAFEVRWAVAGDSIVLQLVAKLENREYMSFGVSGDEARSAMIGGDVVVAWVDKETLKGYAEDYYLEGKSQCSGPRGSCPDTRLADNSNNIRLLNAAMVNGYSIVTYQRPLRGADLYDKAIHTNQSQPVIFAIGPLNQRDEVSFHSLYNKQDKLIDFGRPAKWNCPMPEGDQPSMSQPSSTQPPEQAAYKAETTTAETVTVRSRNPETRRRTSNNNNRPQQQDTGETETRERNVSRTRGRGRSTPATTTTTTTTPRSVPTPAAASKKDPWYIPPIECDEPDDGVFYVQLGPTGGKRGYPAITGHVGWGISWYVNGLLIPEINVVRGRTYTFVTEGGENADIPAKYHPFYITDDPVGGYEHKTPDEKKNVKIYAGADQRSDETIIPTGVGRYCTWKSDEDADDYDSFGAYQRTLQLACEPGVPNFINWTPDNSTPSTVYYQCFSHRYLGWKINVLDSCDRQKDAAASEVHETIAEPETSDAEESGDLEDSPSIRVETKVKLNDLEEIFDKEERRKIQKEEQLTGEILMDSIENENATFLQELPLIDTKVPFKNVKDTGKLMVPLKKVPLVGMFPNKMVLRRPQRPPILLPNPPMMSRRPPMIFKKPYYRPMPPKLPMPIRPMHLPTHAMKAEKVVPRPQNVFVMKPQHFMEAPQRKPDVVLPAKDVVVGVPSEPHVEVSKPQMSTEREPSLLQTERDYYRTTSRAPPKMKLAINTGFNPDSVVIESGFKPIISKDDIEDRMSENEEEDGPEVEIESESGVIDESVGSKTKATEFFEPIFIPSPTLDMKKSMMSKYKKKMYYSGRRSVFDHTPMANERVESYYLPPDNNKRPTTAMVENPMRHRSNSDAPPGTVITFDGKKVSGATLTVRTGDQRGALFGGGSSKVTDFLRSRPQSVPFAGDLPQASYNAAPQTSRVLNRQLDTPPVKLIRQFEGGSSRRQKRDAHHNEEHTSEQQRNGENNASSVQIKTFLSMLITSLSACYYLR